MRTFIIMLCVTIPVIAAPPVNERGEKETLIGGAERASERARGRVTSDPQTHELDRMQLERSDQAREIDRIQIEMDRQEILERNARKEIERLKDEREKLRLGGSGGGFISVRTQLKMQILGAIKQAGGNVDPALEKRIAEILEKYEIAPRRPATTRATTRPNVP